MLPKVILHIGCSLDGRIDWLKPDNFLYYRIIQNWKIDAMLSGSRTLQLAEMSDETNITKLDDQYLIVIDSQGSINNWDVIKRQAYWNDTPIVLCSESTPQSYFEYLRSNQIHYLIFGKERVDLKPALAALKIQYGINIIRVDSGGTLAGVLLRQGLVNAVSVVISPQLTGGMSPKTIFVAPDLIALQDVIDLKLVDHKVMDDDYLHLYYQTSRKEE